MSTQTTYLLRLGVQKVFYTAEPLTYGELGFHTAFPKDSDRNYDDGTSGYVVKTPGEDRFLANNGEWESEYEFQRYYVENGKLSFGEALRFMRMGAKIYREHWIAYDKWVVMSHPSSINAQPQKGSNAHLLAVAQANPDGIIVMPTIIMKNAINKIQPGWAPSQPDMFTDDWYVAWE